MSSASVKIRYDGPALAGHQMEISDLAPALLGISELCKIANRRLNGDRASMQVFIGADQEQKCFQFNLGVVQTLWQHAHTILENHEVRTAKDILEWIGLIAVPAGGGVGLFKLLTLLRNQTIEKTEFQISDGKDVVRIHIEGDGNNVIVAHREAYELLKDESAIANAKKVVQPLTKEGYEKVEFESNNTVTQKITRDEAVSIVDREVDVVDEVALEAPQQITAWVQVYAPVYDANAHKWQFVYAGKHDYMDISGTNIAAKALERGGALLNDTYKVILEIQQVRTATGSFKVKYKIKKVLEFFPASINAQSDWVDDIHKND